MRFLELHLRAFGAFSDPPPITFPDLDGPGLCILYGPNEAGKSTALRAIRSLLYGFPARSPDDFVHRYADLRVAARLRFDDGEELAITRRKRAKESLFDHADREAVSSERLDRLAEAVPESLFEHLYGLDPGELRRGSEALLQDDGELGRALFGASLGVANVRAVLDGLDQEASALFAPRASNPPINAELAAWKETRREIDALALDPEEWTAQEQRVTGGEARLAALEDEIAGLRRSASRAERVRRSLSLLARRRGALERLGAARDVRPLPDDFGERLARARDEGRRAADRLLRARERIERETEARGRLHPSPELLAAQDGIGELHTRIDAYRKTLDQLPRRESELARLEETIESLLAGEASPGPEQMARVREAVASAASTRAHASQGVRLMERVGRAREERAEAAAELEGLRAAQPDATVVELARLDPEPVERALEAATRLGPIDERIAELDGALASLGEDLRLRARRLDLDEDRLERIEQTAFPGHEWIDAMHARTREQASARARLQEQRDAIATEQRSVEEDLLKRRMTQAVPLPEALEAHRAERERIWGDLRTGAIEAEEPLARERRRALADEYERSVLEADSVADRLRLDAERVAERAALEARLARLGGELEALTTRAGELEAEVQAFEAEWAAAWDATGIVPRPPDRMRIWRRQLDELLAVLERRRETQRARQAQGVARAAARRALSEALVGVGAGPAAGLGEVGPGSEELEPGVAEARRWLRKAEAARSASLRGAEALERAERRHAAAERSAREAEVALEAWREEWRVTLALLDLPERARPEQATERLESRIELLERLRERDRLAERIEGMRGELRGFEEAVATLVKRCDPGLAEPSPAAAAAALQRRLAEALEQQTLLRKSDEAIDDARREQEEAETLAATSSQALAALCEQAGVAEASRLDEALRAWQAVLEARRERDEAEQLLAELADGRAIESLEAEAADADADSLAAEVAAIEERLSGLVEEQRRAIEDLRSERDRLASMDGSARAAELAETAEARLAAARRHVDRYVELRMARRILEDEIERYREENQAPLLERAGRLMSALTEGAYPRVRSEVDERGTGVRLLAVTADDREKAVSQLSSGTRDQLFLALRLASLEQALERQESMPLIADDILIEFDDARTRATLRVLAELGRRTQILLLSHHQHVVEIARDSGIPVAVLEL